MGFHGTKDENVLYFGKLFVLLWVLSEGYGLSLSLLEFFRQGKILHLYQVIPIVKEGCLQKIKTQNEERLTFLLTSK